MIIVTREIAIVTVNTTQQCQHVGSHDNTAIVQLGTRVGVINSFFWVIHKLRWMIL